MIAIIQRVTKASVEVNHQMIGAIDTGIMALIGIEKEDDNKAGQKLLERILNFRIFSDSNGRMNLSLRDIHGGLLLVPQFTLLADTTNGNRPSFSLAASPEKSSVLFECLQHYAKSVHPRVETGIFGADMKVTLINDGPVTFTLKATSGQLQVKSIQ